VTQAPQQRRRLGLIIAIVIAIVACGYFVMRRDTASTEAQTGVAPTASTPEATSTNKSAEAQLPIHPTSWPSVDDPAKDGWDSEVLSQRVQSQLEKLGRAILGEILAQDEMQSLVDPACAVVGELVPAELSRAYEDEKIHVDRWKATGNETEVSLASSLESSVDFWSEKRERRIAFKVFRVELTAGNSEFETRQYVAASGQAANHFVEQHATWVARWRILPNSNELRLISLRPIDFEQTVCRGNERLFADCTTSVLAGNRCYTDQFSFGLNYWLERNQDMRYFSPLGNPGLAIGDVNGDGLDDLYVCQESHLPNRLFLHQPDGTARDVSHEWHVDWLESTRSALFIDLDNDGDQDLAAAILGGVVIASNEGNRFVIQDVLETNDDTTSLAAADYDSDGDLDLYVCVDYPNDDFTSASSTQSDSKTPASSSTVQVGAASRVYHDANTAGQNTLFRNDSDRNRWSFRDVTDESGLNQNNRRFTWAAAWEDFDNDGDQDLYVANDFGRNNLYRNDEGRFIDIAAAAGAEDSASGMSAAWADVNRDGNMDLYVSNMFSSAGSRISQQPQFKPRTTQDIKQRLQRFARGNTLLQNSGGATFEDVSVDAKVTVGRWAWSSNFLDVNNDGWKDLAVANGYITGQDTGDL